MGEKNVYEKLNEARLMFQGLGVKQNGKNDYAGYTYFELGDILPAVNKICADIKAACIVTFSKDTALLEFIDAENPEARIRFESPMASASLKGCHNVQNLGAVQTYLKRYLYQNCFEIAESDGLDRTMNPMPSRQGRTRTPPANLGLEQLLVSYRAQISKEVGKQCEDALRSGEKVEEMYGRLRAYLQKKGCPV